MDEIRPIGLTIEEIFGFHLC